MHPDEGTIHAWLDGALDDGEAATLAQHVEACAACAARVAEARGLLAGASRVLSALDGVPGGVIPGVPDAGDARRVQALEAARAAHVARTHARAPRTWGTWVTWRAAAAALLLAGGVTAVVRVTADGSLASTAGAPMTVMSTKSATRTDSATELMAVRESAPMSAPRPAAVARVAAAPVAPARPQAGVASNMGSMPAQDLASAELSPRMEALPAPFARRRMSLPPADSLPLPVQEPLTVVGTVTDERTGEPIEGAAITLEDGLLGALSDRRGHFVIHGAPLGPNRARVRRIGYEAVERELRVRRDSGTVMAVAMPPVAAALSSSVIRGDAARERSAPARVGIAAGSAVASRPGSRTESMASRAQDASSRAPADAPASGSACVLLVLRDGDGAVTALPAAGRSLLLQLAAGTGGAVRFPRSGDVPAGTLGSWTTLPSSPEGQESFSVRLARGPATTELQLLWQDATTAVGSGTMRGDDGGPVRTVRAVATRTSCGA